MIPFPVVETRRSTDFQLWFPEAFARYLHWRYARPEDVAVAFGARHSTAWKWWNAESCPSGHQVARAVMRDPDALVFFAADWRDAA